MGSSKASWTGGGAEPTGLVPVARDLFGLDQLPQTLDSPPGQPNVTRPRWAWHIHGEVGQVDHESGVSARGAGSNPLGFEDADAPVRSRFG